MLKNLFACWKANQIFDNGLTEWQSARHVSAKIADAFFHILSCRPATDFTSRPNKCTKWSCDHTNLMLYIRWHSTNDSFSCLWATLGRHFSSSMSWFLIFSKITIWHCVVYCAGWKSVAGKWKTTIKSKRARKAAAARCTTKANFWYMALTCSTRFGTPASHPCIEQHARVKIYNITWCISTILFQRRHCRWESGSRVN